MRVLVLGHGSAGARHVRHLKALGAEVGSYDPKLAHLADEEVRWLATERLAFEWRPDAVVVATPVPSHARLLFEAASSLGVPTLVEKPLALSVEDYEGEREMHFTCSGVVQVGYQLRCHEAALAFRTAVRAGRVGDVLSARFSTGSHLSTWGGASYADCLLECSHELDAALWVLGPAELRGAARRGETWDLLLWHTLAGAASTVHLSTEERLYARRWEVVGTEGRVTWDWTDGTVTAQLGGGAKQVVVVDPAAALEASYGAQLEAFLDAARGARDVPCGLEDGLAVLRLCDAARAAVPQRASGGAPEAPPAPPEVR